MMSTNKEVINPHLETIDCLDARLVELDLLEQAINAGRDMSAYKLQRLADLKVRINKVKNLHPQPIDKEANND